MVLPPRTQRSGSDAHNKVRPRSLPTWPRLGEGEQLHATTYTAVMGGLRGIGSCVLALTTWVWIGAGCAADSPSGANDDATIATSGIGGGDDASQATESDTGQTPAGATSAATPSPGDSTTGDGTDDGPPPAVFDLGALPDSPMLEEGCRKVDFLFVIDNSGSMSAQQTQMLASFDGFITAIQSSLEDSVDSYHVGVISSDAYTGNAPGCNTLGALVSQTSAGGVCNFADGGRFATEADDLTVAFPCMATLGTGGSGVEQPITGAIAALDPVMAGPGGCNEGFLRDDAILVVVVLTDDPPYSTMDDANLSLDTSGWYDAFVAAKNGDPEALVVIGFVPYMDVSCVIFTLESPNLISFVESFGEQGVLASICEPDFAPAFAETVGTITSTCQNFEPPA